MLSPMKAIRQLLENKRRRGMNTRHDMIDWIGEYPFEFASLDVFTNYFSSRRIDLLSAMTPVA